MVKSINDRFKVVILQYNNLLVITIAVGVLDIYYIKKVHHLQTNMIKKKYVVDYIRQYSITWYTIMVTATNEKVSEL